MLLGVRDESKQSHSLVGAHVKRMVMGSIPSCATSDFSSSIKHFSSESRKMDDQSTATTYGLAFSLIDDQQHNHDQNQHHVLFVPLP